MKRLIPNISDSKLIQCTQKVYTQFLPGGIGAVTGYCMVSAHTTEINPTVLSRMIVAHTVSAAFHANASKCCIIVVRSLLRPLPHRAVAERWFDVTEDTHMFLFHTPPPVVAQWCHCWTRSFSTHTVSQNLHTTNELCRFSCDLEFDCCVVFFSTNLARFTAHSDCLSIFHQAAEKEFIYLFYLYLCMLFKFEKQKFKSISN